MTKAETFNNISSTFVQEKNTLTILSTKIRQDKEGRFCLNDLYFISGSGKEKQPNKWLRTDIAKELVSEIEVTPNMSSPVNIIKNGINEQRGTYVVRELVYAYAMWISPSFHLRVIRAFDAMMTQNQSPKVGRGRPKKIAHEESQNSQRPLFPSEEIEKSKAEMQRQLERIFDDVTEILIKRNLYNAVILALKAYKGKLDPHLTRKISEIGRDYHALAVSA